MNNSIFSINNRSITKNDPPYIIAEISANHNGSIQLAKETILAAKNSGVDAVKIQTYTPDTMTIDANNPDFYISDGLWKDRSLYDLYNKAHTPFEWHEELFEYSKELDITLFSTPFDETAVDLLESLNTPAYKIASFEIVDLSLIEYIAKKNRPILISTGMASIEEIKDALDVVYSTGNDQVALFHCISSYPAPISEANLNSLNILSETFNVEVGLSDHTHGNLASVIAVSLGASIIEKHFTLDRSHGGVDSSFSLEPQEMAELVKDTKSVSEAMGSKVFKRSKLEQSNKIFRRSLYFVNDVNEGEMITKENVRRIRPGFGLDAKYYNKIIGTICNKPARRGDRVTMDHIRLDQI